MKRERSRSREKGSDNVRRRKPQMESSDNRAVWGNVALEEEFDRRKREEAEPLDEKEMVKPDFGVSGALAKDERTGNMVNGVVLKWSAPLDAAMPDSGYRWRLFAFKGEEIVETFHLHRQPSYLFGRDNRVADCAIAHPSCSSQHAVIQFRAIETKSETGRISKVVKPYLLDLGSSNGTKLNGSRIEAARYYELIENDVINFAESTRDYVVIREK